MPPATGHRKRISPLPPIHDAETGKVAMGYKTFAAVIGICAASYAGYMLMASEVSRNSAELKSHAEAKYPHNDQFESVKIELAVTKAAASRSEEASKRIEQNVGVISAKVDFLIQNELEQAQRSPVAQGGARRAASRVRQSRGVVRGDPEDPLRGVEGL